MPSTPLKDLPRLTSYWPVHTTAAPGYLSGLAPQHLAGGPRQPWSSSKEACHSGGKPLHTNMHTKIESRPHSHPHQRPVADIRSPTPVVASPAEASPSLCTRQSHLDLIYSHVGGEPANHCANSSCSQASETTGPRTSPAHQHVHGNCGTTTTGGHIVLTGYTPGTPGSGDKGELHDRTPQDTFHIWPLFQYHEIYLIYLIHEKEHRDFGKMRRQEYASRERTRQTSGKDIKQR